MMKLSNLLLAVGLMTSFSSCQEEKSCVKIVSSTIDHPWQTVFNAEIAKQDLNLTIGVGDSTLTIDPNAFLQTIDGFGACFNEF